MKAKTMALLVVATLFLFLIGCSSSELQYAIEIPYDDFAKVQGTPSRLVAICMLVPVGSPFTVTLWSNQTTGFQWSEQAMVEDLNIVQQTDHEFLLPDVKETVGAAGKERWTFRALKQGITTISTEYSQPWKDGQKDDFEFFLTVSVY
ncbi:protease inhibitor I42 family protein [Chloroflexota bacterium]